MPAPPSADWFVYILVNETGISYTGIAKDVAARVAKHNAGTGARFTRGRGPWRPLHVEGPLPHGDALRREIAIKRDPAFKAELKARNRAAGDQMAFHRDASDIPATPGAYVLLVRLDRPALVRLPGRKDAPLAAGRYLYCGSARGPGGMKARLARHMRSDKSVRWHIDQLTTIGTVAGAWIFPDGDECALVTSLSGLPVPLPGFGSSDCRTCRSHLLFWPDGLPAPASWMTAQPSPNGDRGNDPFAR